MAQAFISKEEIIADILSSYKASSSKMKSMETDAQVADDTECAELKQTIKNQLVCLFRACQDFLLPKPFDIIDLAQSTY
jgi:hypothetical protein